MRSSATSSSSTVITRADGGTDYVNTTLNITDGASEMTAPKPAPASPNVAELPKPAEESKRARFLRVGARRMKSVLKQLKLLGNLSNQSTYEFSDKDSQKMLDALRQALAEFEGRMRKTEKSRFEFD